MKNLFHLFILLILVTGLNQSSFAQKAISEGKVNYSISFPDMELDKEMEAMMPTESIVYFKGPMSRTEMQMTMGFSSATIMNSKTGEIINLTDMLGNKTAVKISADDYKKVDNKNKDSKSKVVFTDETKMIAGYNCKKATMTGKDNATFEIYYSDKINCRSQINLEWKEVDGFPMEFSINQNGLNLKMTAVTVTAEAVADNMFVIPSEYKLMTREEIMKMMGGE